MYHNYLTKQMDCSEQRISETLAQKNLKFIRRRTDKNLNFFTDPHSPYQNAPQYMKQYLSQKIFNRIRQGPKCQVVFVPKQGKTNICTRFFPNGTQYYTCRQCCCQTKIGVTMCFCQSCWVVQKHIGHNFHKSVSSGSAYCDCGRQTRIKPQSFCHEHSQIGEREIIIEQSQRKIFREYFQPLISSYIYLKINGQEGSLVENLQLFINKKLQDLCVGSMYYIRLASEILYQKIMVQQLELTVLQCFLIYNQTCQKMLFSMTGDDQFKYNLIKITEKLSKNQQQSLLQSQFFENDSIFFIFAQKGQFIGSQSKRYIQIAKKSSKGTQLFLQYLQYQQKQKQRSAFMSFLLHLLQQKYYQIIVRNQKIGEKLLDIFVNNFSNKVQWANSNYINLITIVSISLFSIGKGDLVGFENSIQTILKDKTYYSSFEDFLFFAIGNSKQFILKSGVNKQTWFLIILLVIKQSQRKQQLIERLWQGLVKKDQSLREDFIQTLSAIYHMVSITTGSLSHFSQFNQVKDKLQQQRQKWIKSFIYQNGQVSRTQILKMREKGDFRFPNAGQKLKKICKYNQQKDSFEFLGEQKFPNYLIRFKINRNLKDIRNINSKNFRLSDQLNLQIPKYIQQILQFLFCSPGFNESICRKWSEKVQSIRNDPELLQFWKTYQLGFYYVLTLVYGLCFSKSKNLQLKQQINKIRQNSTKRRQILQFCPDLTKLLNLLQIQESIQQMAEKKQQPNSSSPKEQKIQVKNHIVKNEEIQQNQQNLTQFQMKKRILVNKRQKLAEKFKKSAQKFMSEVNTTPQIDQQQFCIICRESSIKDNRLMHIAFFEKNNSIAYSFYGNQDKSEVNIQGCLHVVHFGCFKNINKSGFDFNCPLCSKKSNIYLPVEPEDKMSFKRCENLINAIQVFKYKNHDFHSLLFHLVRYLIGSYGLNSIILNAYNKNEKQSSKKVNKIIQKIINQHLKNSNQFQRQQLNQQFKKLIQSIEGCQKQGLRIVQRFFAKAIYNKLLNQQNVYQVKQLLELESKIEPKDFEIIKQNLQQITGIKIQLCNFQKIDFQGEKISIGIKPKYPPLFLHQVQTFYKKQCQICKSQNSKYVCLLCKNSVCQVCLSGTVHAAEHNSNYIVFDINTKKVHIKQAGGKNNGSHNIYFDFFMTSFEDSSKYKSQQIYELNLSKMQKLFSSYIGRN